MKMWYSPSIVVLCMCIVWSVAVQLYEEDYDDVYFTQRTVNVDYVRAGGNGLSVDSDGAMAPLETFWSPGSTQSSVNADYMSGGGGGLSVNYDRATAPVVTSRPRGGGWALPEHEYRATAPVATSRSQGGGWALPEHEYRATAPVATSQSQGGGWALPEHEYRATAPVATSQSQRGGWALPEHEYRATAPVAISQSQGGGWALPEHEYRATAPVATSRPRGGGWALPEHEYRATAPVATSRPRGGLWASPEREDRLEILQESILIGPMTDTELWRYYGRTGPPFWRYSYRECGRLEQSPININTGHVIVARFDPIQLAGYNLVVDSLVENIEHSVQVRFGSHNNEVRGGGLPGTFILESLHFHWGSRDSRGSEHTINYRRYPMEMHMVHYNKRYGSFGDSRGRPDGKAVLAFFFRIGRYNAGMQAIINQLHHVVYPDTQARMPAFRLSDLMQTMMSLFYRYDGSLTTPPCSETVSWVLFPQTVELSKTQMHVFQTRLLNNDLRTMADNYRPLMGTNDRRVYASHPTLKYTPIPYTG